MLLHVIFPCECLATLGADCVLPAGVLLRMSSRMPGGGEAFGAVVNLGDGARIIVLLLGGLGSRHGGGENLLLCLLGLGLRLGLLR